MSNVQNVEIVNDAKCQISKNQNYKTKQGTKTQWKAAAHARTVGFRE